MVWDLGLHAWIACSGICLLPGNPEVCRTGLSDVHGLVLQFRGCWSWRGLQCCALPNTLQADFMGLQYGVIIEISSNKDFILFQASKVISWYDKLCWPHPQCPDRSQHWEHLLFQYRQPAQEHADHSILSATNMLKHVLIHILLDVCPWKPD